MQLDLACKVHFFLDRLSQLAVVHFIAWNGGPNLTRTRQYRYWNYLLKKGVKAQRCQRPCLALFASPLQKNHFGLKLS